jgi:Ca-activated chloride channel family protein
LLILLALPISLSASPASALKKYEAGKYESSRREYEELLGARPADARLHFNAGTAAFQAQNYDKALKHFSASLDPRNVPLQQRAYYNLGNAQYRLGDDETEPQKKLSHWEEAVQNYESAAKLNPQDADAEYNLELVRKKLEELKKQQQQQQQQKSQDDKKDQSDQKQDQQSKNDQKQDPQPSGQDKQEKNQQQQQQQQESQQQEQKQQAQKPKSPGQDQQPSEANRGSQEKSGQPEEEGGPPQNAVMMRMTPQQARQLLEAMKSEEQTLIFKPQIKTNRQDRLFKDW